MPKASTGSTATATNLIIERSRILGTLLVVNPGADSCVANGPISWSPAVAGYPALLVDADTATDADFSINATNRALSEKENGVNLQSRPAPRTKSFGQDADTNDIYRSAIRGLIAVRDDLTFQNRALVRGQVIVGDDLNNSSGELEVEYLPDSLLNPPPGFLAPYTYLRRPARFRKPCCRRVVRCQWISCQLPDGSRIPIMQLINRPRTTDPLPHVPPAAARNAGPLPRRLSG